MATNDLMCCFFISIGVFWQDLTLVCEVVYVDVACLRHVSFPIAQSWWFSIRSSTLVAGPSTGDMPCISSKSLDVWDTNLMYMVRFMWWNCVVVLWEILKCLVVSFFFSLLRGIRYFCLSSSVTTGNFIQCSNQCLWKRLLSAICLMVFNLWWTFLLIWNQRFLTR